MFWWIVWDSFQRAVLSKSEKGWMELKRVYQNSVVMWEKAQICYQQLFTIKSFMQYVEKMKYLLKYLIGGCIDENQLFSVLFEFGRKFIIFERWGRDSIWRINKKLL